ncbi:MAG: histidine phosphatase family protein [Candidatus Rhabdochlamydia sp.]
MIKWQTVLPLVNESKKVAILLRHGAREPFLAGSLGIDIPLTEEGITQSIALGKNLQSIPLKAIYTSPLKRCMQTAEAIQEGLNKNLPIHESALLGDPGPFVEDPAQASLLFLQLHFKEIGDLLLQDISLLGMRSCREGVHLFLNYLFHIETFPCLMISHDIIIALITAFLNRYSSLNSCIPDFLEGVVIALEEEGITLYSKGHKTTILYESDLLKGLDLTYDKGSIES